jgi:hypothetical protein
MNGSISYLYIHYLHLNNFTVYLTVQLYVTLSIMYSVPLVTGIIQNKVTFATTKKQLSLGNMRMICNVNLRLRTYTTPTDLTLVTTPPNLNCYVSWHL